MLNKDFFVEALKKHFDLTVEEIVEDIDNPFRPKGKLEPAFEVQGTSDSKYTCGIMEFGRLYSYFSRHDVDALEKRITGQIVQALSLKKGLALFFKPDGESFLDQKLQEFGFTCMPNQFYNPNSGHNVFIWMLTLPSVYALRNS